jgi:hypothetical protein
VTVDARAISPAQSASRSRLSISRDHFFAALFTLACLNGLADSVVLWLRVMGWFDGLLSTFNISAIVLLACFAALALLLRSADTEAVTTADIGVGIVVFVIALLPVGKFSWFAVTLLALYVIWISERGSVRRRGAIILLAVTGPALWGPILLNAFAQPMMRADAILVSSLIGTYRYGNLVDFANGSGRFEIAPWCSSFHGISLAVLAVVATVQLVGREWMLRDYAWGLCAVSAVVAVNAGRLSLIGLYRDHFDLIHGPVGHAVASALSFALIVVICLFGVRHEVFARS